MHNLLKVSYNLFLVSKFEFDHFSFLITFNSKRGLIIFMLYLFKHHLLYRLFNYWVSCLKNNNRLFIKLELTIDFFFRYDIVFDLKIIGKRCLFDILSYFVVVWIERIKCFQIRTLNWFLRFHFADFELFRSDHLYRYVTIFYCSMEFE